MGETTTMPNIPGGIEGTAGPHAQRGRGRGDAYAGLLIAIRTLCGILAFCAILLQVTPQLNSAVGMDKGIKFLISDRPCEGTQRISRGGGRYGGALPGRSICIAGERGGRGPCAAARVHRPPNDGRPLRSTVCEHGGADMGRKGGCLHPSFQRPATTPTVICTHYAPPRQYPAAGNKG